MRPLVVFLLALLTAVANAHFRTHFPPPRGPFNATAEVNFCDGYTSPAQNRTPFPLTNGFVLLNFSHGDHWTTGVYVSTSQNPTKFDDFVLHNGFGHGTVPGNYCFPLDFSKSNVTGLSEGQNITIQLLWSGGDGNLFQCSDLTLSNRVDLSTMVECRNSTKAPEKTSWATKAIPDFITLFSALIAFPGLFLLL